MTLASTSSVSIEYKPETTTYGTIESAVASTKYRSLRITSESLDFAVSKTTSSELNATRSISSQVATTASASGGVQGEFSHGEFDPLLQSVMQSTYTAYGTNGVGTAPISFTITGTSLMTGTIPSYTNIKVGQWVRLSSAGANNGKLVRVSAIASGSMTVHASTPVVNGSESITLQTARLTHGTTRTSWSITRKMNDLSPLEYFTYRGMVPSKLSLNIASGSLTTIGFDFMGKDVVRNTGSTHPLSVGTGVATASLTAPIHSGTTATNCVIWAGGSPLTSTYVKSIGLEFDNALGTQEAVCNLGAVGIRSGTINCTISAQLYFAEGAAFFDQFLANTNTELVFSSIDSDGNAYVFTVPQASVATYKVNAGGKDTDLLVDVTFTALRDAANADSALQKVILIDRCGIAVNLANT